MFKNLKKTDLHGTQFISYLNEHNGFISLFGDFYIDGEFFLPISVKQKAGCPELFGNYSQTKYRKYFEQDYYDNTMEEHNNMEVIENSLVLGSSGNYWHDLIDFYSKIFSYDKKIDNNIDKIIIGNSYIKDPIITLLKKLNIQKKIINIDTKTKILKNSFFVSSKDTTKTNDFYRLLFMDNNIKQTKNIYISRKDSNTRSIQNEDEVVNFLKKFDFEVYELSKLTFLEQIKIFNQAKIIVSMHGAALTNLMFCNPETIVVEIAADFYEQNKFSNFDIIVDKDRFPEWKENKTDWFSEINSMKFNKYTRWMYNNLSQMNGLHHYYYFVKLINLRQSDLKSNIEFSFQEITYTNLTIDMSVFKKFFSMVTNFS